MFLTYGVRLPALVIFITFRGPEALKDRWDTALVMSRHTGEIPLQQVRTAFSSMELENMENGGSVLAVA